MTGARLTRRLLGGLDLVIEFATLGEFGLETLPHEAECGGTGGDAGWEAPASARRGGCAPSLVGAVPRPAGRP
jgi:hypothetical protein